MILMRLMGEIMVIGANEVIEIDEVCGENRSKVHLCETLLVAVAF
jgi:hypothetical protein